MTHDERKVLVRYTLDEMRTIQLELAELKAAIDNALDRMARRGRNESTIQETVTPLSGCN